MCIGVVKGINDRNIKLKLVFEKQTFEKCPIEIMYVLCLQNKKKRHKKNIPSNNIRMNEEK